MQPGRPQLPASLIYLYSAGLVICSILQNGPLSMLWGGICAACAILAASLSAWGVSKTRNMPVEGARAPARPACPATRTFCVCRLGQPAHPSPLPGPRPIRAALARGRVALQAPAPSGRQPPVCGSKPQRALQSITAHSTLLPGLVGRLRCWRRAPSRPKRPCWAPPSCLRGSSMALVRTLPLLLPAPPPPTTPALFPQASGCMPLAQARRLLAQDHASHAHARRDRGIRPRWARRHD